MPALAAPRGIQSGRFRHPLNEVATFLQTVQQEAGQPAWSLLQDNCCLCAARPVPAGTYYAAITENPGDFEGKAVMDVGCGSGILSLFAAQVRRPRQERPARRAEPAPPLHVLTLGANLPPAGRARFLPPLQAGARVVYAVEASDMAHHARHLAAANPGIGDRIRVLHGKVEEVEVPEKVVWWGWGLEGGPEHPCGSADARNPAMDAAWNQAGQRRPARQSMCALLPGQPPAAPG